MVLSWGNRMGRSVIILIQDQECDRAEGVVMIRGDAATVNLPCPNRRNQGSQPLAPHDPRTADHGLRAQR